MTPIKWWFLELWLTLFVGILVIMLYRSRRRLREYFGIQEGRVDMSRAKDAMIVYAAAAWFFSTGIIMGIWLLKWISRFPFPDLGH